jgi:Protein of unknown function (DUF3119)
MRSTIAFIVVISILQECTCLRSNNRVRQNGKEVKVAQRCRSLVVSSRSPETGTKLNGFNFDFFKPKVAEPVIPKFEAVTIEPDLRIAGVFLTLGIVLDFVPYIQLILGPFVTLLGILFLVQTFRLRFVFDEDNNLELQTTTSPDKSSGENIVVGGANKWDCRTIVNYDFFPKGWIDSSPTGPILVYFKETQTPSETWNQGPGKAANDPLKIEAGESVAGQVHFFPAICNAKQIRDEFAKRGCRKIEQ